MLLYSRLAPPKSPRKRSRAGCSFWYVGPICGAERKRSNVGGSKAKKKKCDEGRPCSRCIANEAACTYEAVKPRRQRRDVRPADRATKGRNEPEGFQQADDADCASPAAIESQLRHGKSPPRALVQRDFSMPTMTPRSSRSPDLAMIAPYPLPSPLLEFRKPAFSEFSNEPSRRALVDHFCNVVSHRIVFREESGNPFQQLILPLSCVSAPVMNAIYALASAHLEYRGVQAGQKSLYFLQMAIHGLRPLIEKGVEDSHRTELLAAIMLLVYYEVLVQRGPSHIVNDHLKGALTIMNSSQQDVSPTGLFLARAFRFYDVITALSLGTAPLSPAPAAGCLEPIPPLHALPASPLSNVDTLLGMATSLWPIMHRLSNLPSQKEALDNAIKARETSKAAVLRSEFECTSQAIEAVLRHWRPSLPSSLIMRERGVLERVDGGAVAERPLLQAILHNALAYRHSASVYLYRTVYGYPPEHIMVQKHARESLLNCCQTVILRGPMGALLWPLFVAACEATSEEDRALAEQAFSGIDTHQGMINIGKAWVVVHEVWRQLDSPEATSSGVQDTTDLWRKVSKMMGVNIVFG